ncbi:MAG: Stk1 family PASTA domain-containing Ser/Thr kinase [Micrococcales bacterium]|nr:Stk1 family PASTA domain-containing Ser/Thr kinase [Micrococcales bacterium]
MTSQPRDELIGQTLEGRYRVLARLATGGMATVYVAMDERLDREVALKVMKPGLADDQTFVTRFRREARSAARLGNPHVVSVFDQGEQDGLVYLVMEYVPGQTLREVLAEEGALTPRAALDIMDPVLQALASAHEAGIVHRDVKPENVILRTDGMVKVADFGLARAVTSQTQTGQSGVLLGTVAYLSPEQVERGIADPRTDVYAAGLILFELLTGEKAFSGEVPIHVAYQHVHTDVPPPSRLVPGLAPELDDLVTRAAARDPDARPADAGEFLRELREVRGRLSGAELDSAPGALDVDRAHERTRALPVPATAPSRPAGPPAGASAAAAPRRRGRGIPVLLAALLLAAGLAAGWWFMLGPGAMTTVPTVAGTPYASAETALTRAHLRAERVDAFSETVAKGSVITEEPLAGKEVRRGSTVEVSVSKGRERYAVPTLAGRTRAEAEQALKAERLVLGTVSQEWSESVPEGQVISSTPEAGASLKRGASVGLSVSKGRQPIPVPALSGASEQSARSQLERAGLAVGEVTRENSSSVPEGSVIRTSPTAGESRFRGDRVALVISKGPVMVTVPEVTGKQEAEARAILEGAGFKVSVERWMGGIFGTVRSTSPGAGSRAPQGSSITMTVV